MSNPPDPPTNPPPPAPAGNPPPAGDPPAPPSGNPPAEPPKSDPDALAALNRQLEAERRARAKAEQRVAQLDAANQTDAEKAAAKAREEGKAEGIKSAGARLAAAEFRAQAAGKLADPAAMLELLGESKLAEWVNEDGTEDKAAIAAVVERLAQMSPASGPPKPPTPPKVPNGVQPAAPDEDWIRSAIKSG